MTDKKKHGKRYEPSLKEGAVKLVLEKGQPVEKVAEDLGIPKATVFNWVSKARAMSNDDKRRFMELEAENKKLKKDLDDAKDTVAILKKATAIFIKP